MESKPIIAVGDVKTSTGCPACGNPLIINGPGPAFVCSYCTSEIDLGKPVMISLLEEVYNVVGAASKKSYQTTLMTKGHTFNFKYGRGTLPACPKCGKPQPLERFTSEGSEKVWDVTCINCEAPVSVMALPRWLRDRFPGMSIGINAASELPDGEKEKPAIEGVIFSCPKCGGALEIDGKERIVQCRFCSGNVYLPDDLWLRLHPVKKITRWWIGFSDTKRTISIKKKLDQLPEKLKGILQKIEDRRNDRQILISRIADLNRELEDLKTFQGKQKQEIKEEIASLETQISSHETAIKGSEKKAAQVRTQLEKVKSQLASGGPH